MTDCSVLVVSCDRYADVWPPFFALFWRYWPDCCYPVYLGANTKEWVDPRVTMLRVGEDRSWAESARAMLTQIPTQYVLVTLEDFLITKRVDDARVRGLIRELADLGGAYLRLRPEPKPDVRVPGHPALGEIERGAPYRVSLHMAIWDRVTLLNLLRDGETAWDMEIQGSIRSERLSKPFFSTWDDVVEYDKGGVNRGKWTPSAIKVAMREGLTLDFVSRRRYSRADTLRRRRLAVMFVLINLMPWKGRRRLGNALRALKLLPPRAEVA